jgi:hypothetical protein
MVGGIEGARDKSQAAAGDRQGPRRLKGFAQTDGAIVGGIEGA